MTRCAINFQLLVVFCGPTRTHHTPSRKMFIERDDKVGCVSGVGCEENTQDRHKVEYMYAKEARCIEGSAIERKIILPFFKAPKVPSFIQYQVLSL